MSPLWFWDLASDFSGEHIVFFLPFLKNLINAKQKYSVSLYMSILFFSSYEANKPVSLKQIDHGHGQAEFFPSTLGLLTRDHIKKISIISVFMEELDCKARCFNLCVKQFDFFPWALLRLSLVVFPSGINYFFLMAFLGHLSSAQGFFIPFFPYMLKVGIAKNYTCYIDLHINYSLSINTGWT